MSPPSAGRMGAFCDVGTSGRQVGRLGRQAVEVARVGSSALPQEGAVVPGGIPSL